jgi:hypothetical protein
MQPYGTASTVLALSLTGIVRGAGELQSNQGSHKTVTSAVSDVDMSSVNSREAGQTGGRALHKLELHGCVSVRSWQSLCNGLLAASAML